MNFVTRNLGWLLLLGFFIFMLFVISSNDPSSKQGTPLSLVSSGISDGSLDSKDNELQELVDKITIEEDIVDVEVISDETRIDNTKKKVGFFSRIFGKKTKDTEEVSASSSETLIDDSEEDQVTVNNMSNSNTKKVKKEELIVEAKNTRITTGKNLVKNSGISMTKETLAAINTYAPEVRNNRLPGVNLKTAIGNTYDIGVHSLKINNKSFTKKLGFVMKGDRVEQVGKANNRGCFEMIVLDSKIASSVGKSGYVCKKYLSASSYVEEQEAKTHSEIEKYNIPTAQMTKIGDLIEVTIADLMFVGVKLSTGDQLDQMSDIDDAGCFIARVHASNNMGALGKTGTVCVDELY